VIDKRWGINEEGRRWQQSGVSKKHRRLVEGYVREAAV
jgi:hypothetical protein